MSILKKNAQSQAATKAATPAFEAGEDRGDVAVEENPASVSAGAAAANSGVTDVEHTETVRTVTRDDVTETKVSEVAAAGAAAALAKAATPKGEAKAEAKAPAAEAKQDAAPKAEDAAPAASQSTAVAVPQRKVLSNFLSGGKDIPNPLADLRDAFFKAGIPIDHSTFQRLRLDTGVIATSEGVEAGNYIELAVVSFNSTWTVGTGDDSEESKQHVRFSEDGKTIRGADDEDEHAGKTCVEYRDFLRDQGFEKAAVKEYLMVYGIAMDSEKKDFKFMNEIVALSLSPTSKPKFENYILNRAVKARMGKIKEDSGNPVVRFTSERVVGKQRSYFNLVSSDGLTAAPELA
jgi:hypothetical protein